MSLTDWVKSLKKKGIDVVPTVISAAFYLLVVEALITGSAVVVGMSGAVRAEQPGLFYFVVAGDFILASIFLFFGLRGLWDKDYAKYTVDDDSEDED